MPHDPYFQGRPLWVTGSSRGIGGAVAAQMVSRKADKIITISSIAACGTADDIGRFACFLRKTAGESISGQITRADDGEQFRPC